ncbi:MAG: S8 family serine peptidase [Prochlorococcaceae cyanobacterium]
MQWSPTSTAAERLAARAALGGRLAATIDTALMRSFDQGPVEVIVLPPGLSAEQAIAAYGRRTGVVLAEVDGWVGVQTVSNDPYYTSSSRLWGMYSSDSPTAAGPSGTSNSFGSQAEQAWARGFTGSTNVVMGVIDTGIDYTHPDLYLNIWLNQGEIRGLSFFSSLTDINGDGLISFHDLNHSSNAAFVSDINLNGRIDAGDLLRDSRWADGQDNDGNGYRDDLIGWDFFNNSNDPFRASDGDNHGTHVAGTIGGIGGNGLGVAGVNWNVQMMALKFLGPNGGSTSGGIAAVNYYADMTARHDIERGGQANYVATSNSWGGGGYSSTLLNAITNGARVGNLFVAAAGNNATDNDITARYPTNYSTSAALGWDAVVSVAALASTGSLASFSNWGATTVDLGAPGAAINSTVAGGGYSSYSGTSMATPHVSGAIALYAAANPTATPQQILEALYGSTAATSSLAGKTATGGRLDVNAMLAQSSTQPPAILLAGTTNLETVEGGAGASFTVVLSAAPTADVVLRLASSDPATGGPGLSQLVFTTANWSQPQTVTLASVDDWLALGDRSYRIVFEPAASSDSRFNGLQATAITVQHRDNDVPLTLTSGASSLQLVNNVTYSTAPSHSGELVGLQSSSGLTLSEGLSSVTVVSGNGKNRTSTAYPTSALDAAVLRFENLSNARELHFSGFRSDNSEGDSFLLQLSSNGGSWSTVYTVNHSDARSVVLTLATPISGTAEVRVLDSDRTANHTQIDSVTITNLSFQGTITDLRASLSLEASALNLEEGVGAITLTLRRSGGDPSLGAVVELAFGGTASWSSDVLIRHADGTAFNGSTVTFAPGQQELVLELSAVDDGLAEGPETLTITLQADASQPLLLGSASSVSLGLRDPGSVEPISRFSASGETRVSGSVSGSWEATASADGSSQRITEVLSGGSPKTRHSLLEHHWSFTNLSGVNRLELTAEAFSSSADRFRFQLAVNGGSWLDLNADSPLGTTAMSPTSWQLAGPISGNAVVRVFDTNRASGEQSLDWIAVDSLAFLV